MEPPRLMVFTSVENLTHEVVDASGVLAVHPLVRGQERWVARFGFRSGRDVDKFAGVAWRPGETGAPILADAALWVERRVIASVPCGDHVGRLVEPVAAAAAGGRPEPLTFRELLLRDLYRPEGAGWDVCGP